jgi:hypothetical protein
MQQVKIIEGCSNEEVQINEWLKNNPYIEIDRITTVPMLDRYYPNGEICNQWVNTIIVYKEITMTETKDINYETKEITPEEAHSIIETSEPLGLFYTFESGKYVGIDNRTGEAWTEDFKSLELCEQWLKGNW